MERLIRQVKDVPRNSPASMQPGADFRSCQGFVTRDHDYAHLECDSINPNVSWSSLTVLQESIMLLVTPSQCSRSQQEFTVVCRH